MLRLVTVEVITYSATLLFEVVEPGLSIRLEKRLFNPVNRRETAFAKILFVVLSRTLWISLLLSLLIPLILRSWNAIVDVRSTRGLGWQGRYVTTLPPGKILQVERLRQTQTHGG